MKKQLANAKSSSPDIATLDPVKVTEQARFTPLVGKMSRLHHVIRMAIRPCASSSLLTNFKTSDHVLSILEFKPVFCYSWERNGILLRLTFKTECCDRLPWILFSLLPEISWDSYLHHFHCSSIARFIQPVIINNRTYICTNTKHKLFFIHSFVLSE